MNALEEICRRCLAGPHRGDLTAQNVSLYLTAPYMIYCEKFVPQEEKDPRSPYRELLLERGMEHERRVIQKEYPGYRTPPHDTPEEGFRMLLEEMARGTTVICGLPLFHLPEDMQGRPDILERRDDRPSIFGSYHYTVKEIKLSRTIRPEHVLQGAFYTYLLANMQNCLPEKFSIINRDHRVFEYSYAEQEQDLVRALKGTRAILDGRESPTPTYNGSDWPWERYTNHLALKSRDVSLVGKVGPKTKEKLAAEGYRRVWDIAYAEPEALKKIPGISASKAKKLILSAKALLKGRPILIDPGALTFPEKPVEIFLDLEGTDEPDLEGDWEPVDYLIGILVRKGEVSAYRPFVARRFDEEEQMFSAFLDYLRSERDYVLYHWHHYERWHIQRLAERHDRVEEANALIFPHMADLHRMATAAYVFPTYSNGLKDIAAYVGYRWRHEDVNALDAIAYYLKYQQDPEGYSEKMDAVIDYNEDDCVATLRIKDWLRQQQLIPGETGLEDA